MANQVAATLRRALNRLQTQRSQLDRQISAIEGALGVLGRGSRGGAPRGRRRMSASARRAVGKRMKAYWAKRREEGAKGRGRAGK